jgi:hypothetical protein
MQIYARHKRVQKIISILKNPNMHPKREGEK